MNPTGPGAATAAARGPVASDRWAPVTLHPSAHADTFTRESLPPLECWPEMRFELAELRYPPTLNCADRLLDHAVLEGHGDRRCLVTSTGVWTYRDLLTHANQIAHVLVDDCGLVPGNRVLLRGTNDPWLVACWFAVLKAGGVAVTTMPILRRGELRTLGEMGEVRLALCQQSSGQELAAAQIPDLTCLEYGSGRADDLAALSATKSSAFDNVRTSADDVCLLAFTSGTTGRPKATMHFHRDILAIADTFSRHVLRPDRDDLFASTAPLGFTFGLGGLVVFPLCARAASLLLEPVKPDRMLEAVARHGVSVLFTSPTAYRAMLPHLNQADVRSLRKCVSAGERLPAATWCDFESATGLRIIDGIGSTEMLHIFISAAGNRIRPGATGVAVPGFVAEVHDDNGHEVARGASGLLAVKGPTGCRYLHGDQMQSHVRNGWNMTGDIYVRDEDGYFRYQSRADDMIISAGYNIAAPEVEEALGHHPAVGECAVVGVPDADRGMLVKAFVVLRPGQVASSQLARTMQSFVKTQIAPYKYPREMEFVDALPRTSTGKVQRFALR